MARRRQRRGTLVAAALSLIAARASAEAPARVRVVLPACDDAFDKGELVRILRIELTADGVRDLVVGDAADVLAAIRIDATPCAADVREVQLVIDDAATGKSVRRAVALGDVPAASRPRALALATAELLRASWAELSMPDAPPPAREVPESIVRAVKLRPPPPLPSATTTPPPAASPRTSDARTPALVRASVDVLSFTSYQSVVLGPALGATLPLGTLPLRARVDARIGFGRAYDALGTIDLTLVSGDVGLLFSAGTESVRLDVGPLFAVGNGWASGNPAAGATGARTSAVVLTAQGAGSLAVRAGAGWWGVVGVEAGAVVQSLDAQAAGRPASGFGGPLLGASIGVGHEL